MTSDVHITNIRNTLGICLIFKNFVLCFKDTN